uniref:Receptor ligand binding region domain-containing protein n=1 Tax=Romanomermis culicivorax TaxID=13658 RepID=A0A915J5Q8_ROMCU
MIEKRHHQGPCTMKKNLSMRFDDCDAATAAGAAVRMYSARLVDAMIGPPCASPALAVAVLAKYFNIPIFNWAATSTDLTNNQRFPIMARVIGSSIRLVKVGKLTN